MVELKKPYQIEIAGVGGTGVLTAANLIGNAALIENIYAVQSEIHGMAQRGGVVNTEVRLGPVSGSLIPDGTANVLLSFELVEAARAIRKIRPNDGYVIINHNKIIPPSLSTTKGAKYPELADILEIVRKFSKKTFVIDAFKLASELGDTRMQNTILVGALFAIPDFPLKKESIREALKVSFRGNEKLVEMNMKAFDSGFKKMKELMKE